MYFFLTVLLVGADMSPLYILIFASAAAAARAQTSTTAAPPRHVLSNAELRNQELILHRMEQLQCRQETGYTCGAAVLRTLFEYFGVPCREHLGIFWERGIAAAANTNCVQGIIIENLVRTLNDFIRSHVSTSERRTYSVTEVFNFMLGDNVWSIGRWIHNSLANNSPVILLYSHGDEEQNENVICHYVIIYGIRTTSSEITFYVYDPETGITRNNGQQFMALIRNYGYIVHHQPDYVVNEEPENRGPRPSTSGNTLYQVDLPDPWCETYHPHSLFLTYPDQSDRRKRSTTTNSTHCPEIVNVIYKPGDSIYVFKEFEMKVAKVNFEMSTANVISWAFQKYPKEKFKLYLTRLFSTIYLYNLYNLNMRKADYEAMSSITYDDYLLFNEKRIQSLAKGKTTLTYDVHFHDKKTVWNSE